MLFLYFIFCLIFYFRVLLFILFFIFHLNFINLQQYVNNIHVFFFFNIPDVDVIFLNVQSDFS